MKRNSVLKLHSELVCAPFDLWLARIAGTILNATFIFTWVTVIGASPNTMKDWVGLRRPNESGCKRNITFD
jgi:hypothetical protein